MRYFKDGLSDCKNALMEIVNMLSDVLTPIFNYVFQPVYLEMLRFAATGCK
jgi:hypothetical protein